MAASSQLGLAATMATVCVCLYLLSGRFPFFVVVFLPQEHF